VDIRPEVLKQSIESLLRLQEIDSQVFKLKLELENLPAEMLDLQKKMLEADAAFKSADRAFRDADRERRSLELKGLTLMEDVRRAENKKREVRNTKEEFAAGKEVDSFHRKQVEIKASLGEKTALTEQKTAFKTEKQEALTKFQSDFKSMEEARNARLSTAKTELLDLEKQRDVFISKVDELIFSLYERVQRIRKGSGIALVKVDICQGCFVSIPPHTRIQLLKLSTIITCSGCSRILFPEEEISPGITGVQAKSA